MLEGALQYFEHGVVFICVSNIFSFISVDTLHFFCENTLKVDTNSMQVHGKICVHGSAPALTKKNPVQVDNEYARAYEFVRWFTITLICYAC